MSILTHSANFEYILKRVFGGPVSTSHTGYSIGLVSFIKGPQPTSAEAPLNLSTDNFTGNTYGASLSSSNWSAPSNGISILLSSFSITVPSGVVNATLTCLRPLSASYNTCIFVVPVDTVKGPYNAVVNKVTGINTGDVLIVSDLRIKVATEGEFSFNNNLANAIVSSIIGAPSNGYRSNYRFGSPGVLDNSTIDYPRDLFLDIYDSATIPSSANNPPEGTLLWSRNLKGANLASYNIFTHSGPAVSYSWPGQAAAVATGTPKYLRISQPGIQAGTLYYPEMVMQIPFGVGVGFAQAPAPTMVIGQNYSLGEFSFIIRP